jgi:hypothetical protein
LPLAKKYFKSQRIFKVNATRKNIPVAFTLNVIGVAFSLKVKEMQKEG